MEPLAALAAFSLAAGLLTVTPGLDTALVLRTAAVEGPRPAMAAGAGVVAGVLAWGLATALGLGAMVAVSPGAYAALRIAGAAYLVYLGLVMLRGALTGSAVAGGPVAGGPVEGTATDAAGPSPRQGRTWFARGLTTNLLNPKVGVFYVSFLPQFLPAGIPVVGFSMLLAAIHAVMGLAWFALLTAATRPLGRILSRPAVARLLDAGTGTVLLGFALRLAFD